MAAYVSYLPDRSLPISTVPLPAKTVQSEAECEPLFDKLRQILSDTEKQVAGSKNADRIVFLLLNLSPDVGSSGRSSFLSASTLYATSSSRRAYEPSMKRQVTFETRGLTSACSESRGG
jgi:hypothetical protein